MIVGVSHRALALEPIDLRAPRAIHTKETELESAVPLPMEPPPEVKQVTQMLLASGSNDPVEALLGVLQQIRAMSSDRAELDVRGAEQRREVARLDHERAVQEAKEAAEKRIAGAPRWIKKLVSAIVTAVGVAAAAFTGGASLGLAVAGAVLLLASDGIAKLAVKLGMKEEHAGWLKLGLQVAGAALMMGAGFAGGAAAVPNALQVTQKAVKVVGAAMEAVEGALGVVDQHRALAEARAQSEVDRAALELEASDDDFDRVIEMLAAELTRMRRENEAASGLVEASHAARRSAIEGGIR